MRRSIESNGSPRQLQQQTQLRSRCSLAILCVAIVATVCSPSWNVTRADTYTFNDGRSMTGQHNTISSVAADPSNPRATAGGVDIKQILLIDDDYRRVYIPTQHLTNMDPIDVPQVTILVEQNVAEVGHRLGSLGPVMGIKPWDKYGRRSLRMNLPKPMGPISIVQGITEITPTYTRVQGLRGSKPTVIWDMRIATSSIPRNVLATILKKAIPQDDVHARLSAVQLYLQSERFTDASKELEQIVKDFPKMKGLEREVRNQRQRGARYALKEIELRRKSGQHYFTRALLEGFPSDGVAGETLQHVKQVIGEYDERQQKLDKVHQLLSELIPQIKNKAHREFSAKMAEEIKKELTFNALGRMATLLQFGDSKEMKTEEKVSLAISGWLVGSDYGTDRLPVALSLVSVRDLVAEYLQESMEPRRKQLAKEIKSKEGGTPEQVARILRQMKPPGELPKLVDERIYGYFQKTIPGLNENPDVRYLVQVPPEYDPLKAYPTIITLPGAGSTPELQLDFWAGGLLWKEEGEKKYATRNGQGMRHGYITVAIDWRKPYQNKYEFSAREHYAVLTTLRDVSRSFSINMDKVFLTGHDIGGDAAWDIALAHPDHWAGVMPIVGDGYKYCDKYWQNAKYVPFYVVFGQHDGASLSYNSMNLTRYMKGKFDTTVVEIDDLW